MLSTIKETLHDSFNLRIDLASPEEIQEDIEAGAKVKGTNMCILILAILIASIGLNMNSTAVIIGAMLISPLMGGIQAIGYGIAVNDLSASKKAAVGLCFQVFICILTSTVYFSISPISSAHSEILARTSPSVWDVLIALFGGLAGIIGITRKEKSNVIPGVAIATALMPPLCTAGFGIATRNFKFFIGAMYLFFINSFFICLATIIILKIIKLPCKQFIDKKAKHKLYLKITVIAVITVIPSIVLAVQLISDSIESNNITSFMKNEFQYSDTQIVRAQIDEEENTLEVALLGKQLPQSEIERLQKTLPDYNLEQLSLKVTQPNMEGVVTSDDLQKYFADGHDDEEVTLALKDQEISTLKDKINSYESRLQEYESHDFKLDEIKKNLQILYPSITELSIGMQKGYDEKHPDSYETLLGVIQSSEELSEEDEQKLTDWFKLKTNESSVTLICNTEE